MVNSPPNRKRTRPADPNKTNSLKKVHKTVQRRTPSPVDAAADIQPPPPEQVNLPMEGGKDKKLFLSIKKNSKYLIYNFIQNNKINSIKYQYKNKREYNYIIKNILKYHLINVETEEDLQRKSQIKKNFINRI